MGEAKPILFESLNVKGTWQFLLIVHVRSGRLFKTFIQSRAEQRVNPMSMRSKFLIPYRCLTLSASAFLVAIHHRSVDSSSAWRKLFVMNLTCY
jgi:hypothetical protein